MHRYATAPFVHSLLLAKRYWQLIWEMTLREFTDRHSGQVLGLLWTILHPLFLIVLYVFVFTVVLDLKMSAGPYDKAGYPAYLLAGLIPWMGFQEALIKSCFAIQSNSGLVKQIVFPIEVLAVKCVASSLITQGVATVLFLIYIGIFKGQYKSTYLLLPYVLAIQTIGMLGCAYLLSAISVFLKDIKDLVQLFCTAGLYLIPVFYLPDWLPPVLKPLLAINPLSHMVWCYQDILFFGSVVHPMSHILFPVFCMVMFVVGYHVFQRLKPMYGSVL